MNISINSRSLKSAKPVAAIRSKPRDAMDARADQLPETFDPIFAAIQNHRFAEAAFKNVCDGRREDVAKKLIDAESQTLRELVDTRPTTLKGAAEALRYVEAYLADQDDLELPFSNFTHIAKSGSKFLSRIASVIEHAPPHDQAPASDAALLSLGREHDRLEQKYAAAEEKLRPLNQEFHQRFRKWLDETPEHTNDDSIAATQRFADELGLTAIGNRGEHTDDIADEMYPIARAIMEIPATTTAGLAVKAKVAAFNACDYWDDTDADCDWDKLCVRKLIDDVLRAADLARPLILAARKTNCDALPSPRR